MNRTIYEEYIFGCILLLANKMQVWGDGIVEDITLKQWFLLMLISKMHATNPSVNEIADFSGTSRQNIKKMLGQLEKKGYVLMSKSETDARALCITLSDKTWTYFSKHEEKAADSVNKLFSSISDEELLVTSKTLEKLLVIFGNPKPDLEAMQ